MGLDVKLGSILVAMMEVTVKNINLIIKNIKNRLIYDLELR